MTDIRHDDEVHDALVRVLRDRGAQLAADRLSLLDTDVVWERWFGPLVDEIETALDPALARRLQAERRMLELMKDAGLPPPAEVQHGEDVVRFLWPDKKVAVVIEVEE